MKFSATLLDARDRRYCNDAQTDTAKPHYVIVEALNDISAV